MTSKQRYPRKQVRSSRQVDFIDTEEHKTAVGIALLIVRRQYDLSQDLMGAAMGVSRGTYVSYESGRANIPFYRLDRLLYTLRMELSEFNKIVRKHFIYLE